MRVHYTERRATMKNLQDRLKMINPTTLRTLIELHRLSGGGKELQIGVDILAEQLDITGSALRRHLRILNECGFLEVEAVMDSVNRSLPNVYILKDDRQELMDELFIKG